MKNDVEFSSDELLKFLNKIQRISRMAHDDALEEVKEFVTYIIREHSGNAQDLSDAENSMARYYYEKAQEDLGKYQNEFEDNKRLFISRNYHRDQYELLRIKASEFGRYWKQSVRNDFTKELETIRGGTLELADAMELQWHLDYLSNENNFTISSTTSISRILRDVYHAENCFIKYKALNDKEKELINAVRSRCAWYRAKKKIEEAEIAKVGSKISKYNKLMAEAQVVLKQDWEKVFPGDPFPVISCVCGGGNV